MMVLEISQDYDLSKLSTLRVKARAEYFAAPASLDELKSLFEEIRDRGWRWYILGAGSNTLLSSRSVPGVLISTNNLDFYNQLEDGLVEVGAGLRMPRFCALTARESLAGTEFMEGIPGSIGGGVVMNAGAHGSEIANILDSAQVFNLETLELETWSKVDLGFAYRHSVIDPNKHLVYSATFKLAKGDKQTIREKIVENNHARTSRQPIKSWTCGCTFKNPSSDLGAGLLIQELGLKGYELGDFKISELHGNFFENHGQGTSMDFCKLMQIVQAKAKEDRGVILKPEVQAMGEFSQEELKIWS